MHRDAPGESTAPIPRRVIVKFRDAVVLPYEDGAEEHVIRAGIGPWQALAERFKGIRLDRLFTIVSPERIGDLVALASERDRTYRAPNLLTYFVVPCPPESDPEAIAAALREWTEVDTAYVDPLDESPGPTDPDYTTGRQSFLRPPAVSATGPKGAIDAEYAWTQPGGTGTGQKIVDLERGAKLDHEDLVARAIPTLHGINAPADRPHGASVLGVVAAVGNNGKGGAGIAHGLASAAYTCQVLNSSTVDRPQAVMAAIEHFSAPGEDPLGRVLLLEVQLNPLTGGGGVTWSKMPMETVAADFDVIRLATALGIAVVEAAGNGKNDLDLYQDVAGTFVLARTRPADFKDSGAIMVGGSTSRYPYTRSVAGTEGTSFGTRVDCFAWADGVRTCGVDLFGGDVYRDDFGGTSAAAAIVAGAALLVQGAAEASLGHRLSPGQLRVLLSDLTLNTPSASPGNDRIGVMPNLRRILQEGLAIAPDVYLRDHVGDTGSAHAGAIAVSPDIIVRSSPSAAPAVAFGPGTEADLTLGQDVVSGQDNFVYVRVWNRGNVDATAVTATVYHTAPATLPTPVDWKPVGSTTIATVPKGNVMTVAPVIVWPAAQVPPSGHYCFVALVHTARDPAPAPAGFLDFDNYYAYIRTNNNVTWRNFNVVALVAPPSGGAADYGFEFMTPGAADRDRDFQLAVGARLPADSEIALEVPLELLGDHRLPGMRADADGRRARIRISPHGRTTLPSLRFPAGSRAMCRLLVHLPGGRLGRRARDGEVYVSQLYEGFDVGRITWRLIGSRPAVPEEPKPPAAESVPQAP